MPAHPAQADHAAMRALALSLPVLLLLAAPAPAQAPPPAARELDRAFEALRAAPDAEGGQMAEAVIRQIWARQASPAVQLLLNRGIRNLRASQTEEALEDFDAAIILSPNLADAWHWRAQAHARAGDNRAAAADLREALRLEPRHFAALLSLSRLQETAGDAAGALRSQEAALEIHPRLPGGAERLRELRRQAEGERM
ncbi:tetratricopeptide repeat protein [Sabulicella rubraurantiaca]|uniref:tetratricopeptide repeat protein n=1 Tax=Sabulicella rubraurantiaca TaxID=2811429 RepID=UPI001A957CE5|nr:tetratricopeptide repeat protein [Sabulicella rubraurantiaca]